AIMVEPKISTPTDTTVGTVGARRGVVVVANTVFNAIWGIHISYAAKSIVMSNLVHDCAGDGISGDSNHCVIADNIVYNVAKSEQPADQLGGAQGGIRWWGKNCIFQGNYVFDNQIVKTTPYGIAVDDAHHVIVDNHLEGCLTGAISTSTGTTNRIVNNEWQELRGAVSLAHGASPYTFTAGPKPEVLYVVGGSVSGITKNDMRLPTNGAIDLEPGESISITYSIAPILMRERK
ncbi:MAG: hypothetical protein H0W06_04040, partial [Chloroflexia bacterium]|nr:hypothetical protein [Chloroflexia bacterium]